MKDVFISYCGIICEYCPAYRARKCPGCDSHADSCKYIACLMERNVRNCLLCPDFPCKLHLEGFEWETSEYGKIRWKVYSDIFLKIMQPIKKDDMKV